MEVYDLRGLMVILILAEHHNSIAKFALNLLHSIINWVNQAATNLSPMLLVLLNNNARRSRAVIVKSFQLEFRKWLCLFEQWS